MISRAFSFVQYSEGSSKLFLILLNSLEMLMKAIVLVGRCLWISCIIAMAKWLLPAPGCP
uniref:ORF 60 n=1 Tax=Lactococcus phage mv4 TaxID=12392 RepID=Q9G0D3_BPMV4|nr:ORF 60 [Lactobacillus phage mv4]